MTPLLTETDRLPAGLLQRPAHRLHEVLSGPTLVHLEGRREAPLCVSVLLHGNEDTGWEAVRSLLDRHATEGLPRSLSLFIGNVAAAQEGRRRLPGQADFNRIWNGGEGVEHVMAARVLDAFAARRPFASIDVHNNTGRNPHYACLNRLEQAALHLAVLFSRTVVYFLRPDSVHSMAMSRFCPAVTVECGKPGVAAGLEHVEAFLDAALRLAEIPSHPVPAHDYDLFHTVATVRVPDAVTFSFGNPAQVVFAPDLDELNFRELPPGTAIGRSADGLPFEVTDEAGRPVVERFFTLNNGEIVTRVPVMPSMLTLDERVIRQDCLCYLMERLPPLPA